MSDDARTRPGSSRIGGSGTAAATDVDLTGLRRVGPATAN